MAPLGAIRAPAPLRDLPAWVCWRFEQHEGETKPRKVPFWASGQRRFGAQGSDIDRARLVTFDRAMAAAIKHGMDGVGLALLEDWGVVALDFDNCVDDDGNLPEDIRRIAHRSYAEWSPSGRGVRVLLKGNLGNHKSAATAEHFGFETFSTNGFVTITGDILAACEMVGLQDTVAPVDDFTIAFAEGRFGALHGPAFDPDDFMAGMSPKTNLTPSEMEDLLAKLSPDMGRGDWIRVGAGLHHETDGGEEGFHLWNDWSATGGKYVDEEDLRKDWASFDRRTGARRAQVTMRSVLKMVNDLTPEQVLMRSPVVIGEPGETLTTPAQWIGKFPIRSVTDLVEQPSLDWFIKGILPKAGLGMLFGDSTSGKSFLALDMAAAIARGVDWHGRKTKKSRVVYVVAEGAGSFGKRLQAYCAYHKISTSELSENFGFITDAPNLLDTDDVVGLVDAVHAAGGADLIMIDTWAQTTPGADENSGEHMGKALGNVGTIRNGTDADVLIVHHPGKDLSRGARGWSGVRAAVDVELEVTQYDEGKRRQMRTSKLKDGDATMKFHFKLDVVQLGVDADGDAITSCVVIETDPPTEADNTILPKDTKRRDNYMRHVMEVIETLGDVDAIGLEDLVTTATGMMTKPEFGPDRRRQNITRAIQELAKEKPAPLAISNNRVMFY